MLYRALIISLLLTVAFVVACDAPIMNHTTEQGSGPNSDTEAGQQKGRDETEDEDGRRYTCSGKILKFGGTRTCLKWLLGPRVGEESRFALEVDREDCPSVSLSFKTEPWMDDHGHGTSPVKVAIDGCRIDATEVYFIMPGRWNMRFELDGKKVDYEVVL